MQDSINQAMTSPMAERVVAGTGVATAGVISAPKEMVYNNYLIDHGWLFLSYAEWIQVLGAIYVFILIATQLKRGLKAIFERFYD